MLHPLPSRLVSRILTGFDSGRVIGVEGNIVGQVSVLIAMNTGFTVRKHTPKYNGRPIYVMELVEAVRDILEGRSSRVVLNYGK